MLQHALLLTGHRCAIEHDGLWLAQFQTLGDTNPIRLGETYFFNSGEVPTPQTHTTCHDTMTCPLNSPYPTPTLSLGGELLHRMDFGDENETSTPQLTDAWSRTS